MHSDLLRRALDGAYVAHFAKLFEVLMAQPSDASAFDRFIKGLEASSKACERIERHVATMQKNERAGS